MRISDWSSDVCSSDLARRDSHGPLDSLVAEMRDKARAAGLLTPHIRADGSHLSQRATARVLQASGLSPPAPLALNTAAPDEGNMLLLGSVATVAQKAPRSARRRVGAGCGSTGSTEWVPVT